MVEAPPPPMRETVRHGESTLTISQDYPPLQAGLHPHLPCRARLPNAGCEQRVACSARSL